MYKTQGDFLFLLLDTKRFENVKLAWKWQTIVSVLEIAPAEAYLCNGAGGPGEVLGTDQLHRIIQPVTVNQEIKVIEGKASKDILVGKNTRTMRFRVFLCSGGGSGVVNLYKSILLFVLNHRKICDYKSIPPRNITPTWLCRFHETLISSPRQQIFAAPSLSSPADQL